MRNRRINKKYSLSLRDIFFVMLLFFIQNSFAKKIDATFFKIDSLFIEKALLNLDSSFSVEKADSVYAFLKQNDSTLFYDFLKTKTAVLQSQHSFQDSLRYLFFTYTTTKQLTYNYQKANFDAVPPLFHQLKSTDENSLRMMANSFYQLQKYDSALCYYKAMSDTADSATILLASCYEKLNQFDSAHILYKKLAHRFPDNKDFAQRANATNWTVFFADNWYYLLILFLLLLALVILLFKIITKETLGEKEIINQENL